MKLLNCTELAEAMNVPRMFVTAMRAEGYQFPYQHQTTLQHALAWRADHRHFRYSDYIERKRKTPRPPRRAKRPQSLVACK